MVEIIITLCMLNPCYEIPGKKILMVPNPLVINSLVNPDDVIMYESDDLGGYRIKWVGIPKSI